MKMQLTLEQQAMYTAIKWSMKMCNQEGYTLQELRDAWNQEMLGC